MVAVCQVSMSSLRKHQRGTCFFFTVDVTPLKRTLPPQACKSKTTSFYNFYNIIRSNINQWDK